MQTLALSDIGSKVATALATSVEIDDWCQTKYDKSLTVYHGWNVRKPPTIEACPSAMVLPGSKIEGDEQSENHYSIRLHWAVMNEEMTTDDTTGVNTYTGAVEVDELGQLFLAELAELSQGWPISRADYNIDTQDRFPQFTGTLDIDWLIPVIIGGGNPVF